MFSLCVLCVLCVLCGKNILNLVLVLVLVLEKFISINGE